ncbi:19858_t:CDS:1, partial [Racocetra fulgida]
YSGISKDELDWILGDKSINEQTNHSIVCSDDNFDNYQSYSSEYVANTDEVHDVPQSENDMLLPKGQSSRSHRLQKIPWKLLLSRREV